MGAKDWMLFYAEGDVRNILQAAPSNDRNACRELVAQLYAGHEITEIDDGTLSDNPNPPRHHLYAGCFPGLTVLCTEDAALDMPSKIDQRFLRPAKGRTIYLHAMHSVVNWFSYAIWTPDGHLQRALSLSPDSGILENLGAPMPFERPYWAGEHSVDDELFPLPFDPLELAEDALRALFGFNYEGIYLDDDPVLENIALAGFTAVPGQPAGGTS